MKYFGQKNTAQRTPKINILKISHLHDGCEDKFTIFTMEFTNQGKDMLIDGGYLYVYKQPLAGNRHSWECRVHRKKLCKALVMVLDNAIVGRVNDHTQAPNATQIEVTKVPASIKRKAWTTHGTPQDILTTELANVSNEAVVNLPPMRHIRHAIRSQRENINDPNIPQHRQDLPAIPNEYAITTHGDDSRIILFATDDDLETLCSSDHWFGDGTFEVSPSIFFQLYTIHAICNEQIMLCVFALLPNITQIMYGRLGLEITYARTYSYGLSPRF